MAERRLNSRSTERNGTLCELATRAVLIALTCLHLGCEPDRDELDGGALEGDGSALIDASPDDTGTGPRSDAGPGPAPDAADTGTDATIPDPSDEDGGIPCESDDECDDDLVCNGEETCVDGLCSAGAPKVCSPVHPCREELLGCDCRVPSMDGDNYADELCGGDDCDDSNAAIHPDRDEQCDPQGVDEDCNAGTVNRQDEAGNNLDGDEDQDGYVSSLCFNVVSATGEVSRGDDCHDGNPDIRPGVQETCNYKDDDCNGLVDEAIDEDGMHVAGGLREAFFPDFDDDGCGDMNVEGELYCYGDRPPRYVGFRDACDCDDSDDEVYTNAPEVCDGKDNDCDALVDAADEELEHEYDFTGTDLTCDVDEDRWMITRCPEDLAWCDHRTVEHGCETDATTLSNCRSCGAQCRLACGLDGCDEVETLAVGSYHSCASTSEGNVVCWGRGGDGRLGNDSTQQAVVPERAAISEVSAISTAFDHTCAIAGSEGAVYCWGSNSRRSGTRPVTGQIGSPDANAYSTVPLPVLIAGAGALEDALQVAAGLEHSCAVLHSGLVYCWGERQNGLLGTGYEDEGPSRAETATRGVYDPELDYWYGVNIENGSQVVTGERHSCLRLDTGAVECWGDNAYGQLGRDAETTVTYFAVPVEGLEGVTMLAAGMTHTCALAGGSVHCWGNNEESQLGRITDGDNHVPKPVEGLSDVSSIALGNEYSCALHGSGKVSCWGANDRGVFGVPKSQLTRSITPVMLPLQDVIQLSAGAHLCAQTRDLQVHCLGSNDYGQLGNGTSSPDGVTSPVRVAPLRGSKL